MEYLLCNEIWKLNYILIRVKGNLHKFELHVVEGKRENESGNPQP